MSNRLFGLLAGLCVFAYITTSTQVHGDPNRLTLNTPIAATILSNSVLVSNSDFLAVAKPSGPRMILALEALSDGTNNLGGKFPKTDFVSIRVDVNQNGKIDPKVDVIYGIRGSTKDQLCAQYMLSATSNTGCGAFKSGATLKVDFKATKAKSTPHPVWVFSIPNKELSRDGKYAHLKISFYRAGKGYTYFPQTGSSRMPFAKVSKISLSPVKPAKVSRFKPIIMKPAIMPQIGLKVRSSHLIQTESHLVSVLSQGDNVVFTMEALKRYQNHLKEEYPRLDFTSIRVDVNRNGKVDAGIDIAYGILTGTYEKLCSQILISESSSKTCGSFSSRAQLKVGFHKTPNSSRPHPVWVYTIPKRELGREEEFSNLVFIFHEAGKGYSRFPPTQADKNAFADPLVLNLKTLQGFVADVETDEAKEDQPEVVTNDVKPPIITISNPSDAEKGEIRFSGSDIDIRGSASDESGIYKILVNNEEAVVSADGTFHHSIRLAYGSNDISVQASDVKDNTAKMIFRVIRESGEGESDDGRGVGQSEKPEQILEFDGANRALLIGIETYDDPDIHDLDEPIDDAEKLKEILIDDYAFKPSNVEIIRNPDRKTIFDAFQKLKDSVASSDSVLIFYAGHGMWDEQSEVGYWLPKDAENDNQAQWISNHTIKDFIDVIPSRHTLLISDACFSGSIIFQKDRGGIDTESDKAIQELYKKISRKAMTSGTLTEVPDRSEFLKRLTLQLKDNTQDYLSADQLFYQIRLPIMQNSESTPQYGAIQNTGDVGGEFVFIRRATNSSQ